MKRSLTSLAVAAFGIAGIASADVQSGELVATSADTSVFAVRGGETLNLVAGDAVFAGDRIMTSGEGAATVSFAGCSVDVPAANMIVLSDDFCDATIEGPGFGQEANLQLGLLPILGGLAAVGAITGIVIAATDDDDVDAPTSP